MRSAAGPGPNPFVAINGRQRAMLLGAFSAYLVLIAIARTRDPTPTDDWIPAALLLYVGLVAAPLLLLRRNLGWFHPLVFSSLLRLVDLLRRAGMYAWGLDWHRALPAGREELSDLIEFQLLLHALAVASHYAGYFFGPRLPMPQLWFGTPRAMVPRLLIVFAISLVVFLMYIARQGGLSAHIGSWAGGRHEQIAGQHYLFALAQLGIPACWTWLAVRRNALRSPLFWGAVLMTLSMAFLMTGSRGTAIYGAIGGLMIWMLRDRRISYVRVLVVAVVAIYAITALGSFRRSGWYGDSNLEAAREESLFESVTSGAGGELAERSTTADGGLPIFAKVPDDVPLLYGSSYLAIVTLPIPRGIFPEKPTMVDGQVGRVFFGLDAGVPPGGVGEAYWNFHIPGVVAVYFLFGVFHAWLARLFLRHGQQPAVIALFASAMLLFREPSGLSFVQWLMTQVPLLVILVWVGALGFGRGPAPRGAAFVRT